MEEYKFRGKEVDTGKWVYGGLFKEPAPPQCFEKTLKDKYWIVYPNPRYMPDWNLPYQMIRTDVDKETIGQYTGLKDKNGKEIYEGDIVKINDEIIAKVIWDNDYLGYFLYANEENSIDSFENGEQPLYGYWGSIEVIGNKWDNSELLEEGE